MLSMKPAPSTWDSPASVYTRDRIVDFVYGGMRDKIVAE